MKKRLVDSNRYLANRKKTKKLIKTISDLLYLTLVTIVDLSLLLMNLDRYQFQTNASYLDFEFESDGPNGKIKKVVRFSPQNANGVTYFNLGFGDLNPITGAVDDLSKSNNNDRDKILATIASIVLEFTAHFPDVMVYAQGSTSSRTRLYQMGIAANWNEIVPIMHVYGYRDNTWQRFEKQVNYEAFLVMRKQ